MSKRSVWQLERFDHSRGGWRPVRKAFDDDDPARFNTKAEAEERKAGMEGLGGHYAYRVRKIEGLTSE